MVSQHPTDPTKGTIMRVVLFRLPDLNPNAADAPFYVPLDGVTPIPTDAEGVTVTSHAMAADTDALPYNPDHVAEVRERVRNTIHTHAFHVSSDAAYAECDRLYGAGLGEVSDDVAVTIASWWASSGPIGRTLAALSTGRPVRLTDLLDDIHATRVSAPMRSDRDDKALAMLATWAINHRKGQPEVMLHAYQGNESGAYCTFIPDPDEGGECSWPRDEHPNHRKGDQA